MVPKRGISLHCRYDTGAAARMVFTICRVYDAIGIGSSFDCRKWRHFCYVEPHAGTDRGLLAHFLYYFSCSSQHVTHELNTLGLCRLMALPGPKPIQRRPLLARADIRAQRARSGGVKVFGCRPVHDVAAEVRRRPGRRSENLQGRKPREVWRGSRGRVGAVGRGPVAMGI